MPISLRLKTSLHPTSNDDSSFSINDQEQVKRNRTQWKQQFSKLFCPLFMRKRSPSGTPKNYGVHTMTGKKPENPNWSNQDRFIIFENSRELHLQELVCAVFDGHGPNGHHASTFCKDRLLGILSGTGYNSSETFAKLQQDMEYGPIDVSCSGTTCTLIFIKNKTIEIANVGDSSAVLARRDEESDAISHVPLSYEHTPNKAEETTRIQKCGGKIYARQVSTTKKSFPGGTVAIPVMGPPRVWYKLYNQTNLMGLAMTRSLGDSLAHRVGVSHEPHVTKLSIQTCDEYIVLASDGLWDVYNYTETIMIVEQHLNNLTPNSRSYWDPQEIAELLTKKARKRWEEKFTFVDDITCIVIKLKNGDGMDENTPEQ